MTVALTHLITEDEAKQNASGPVQLDLFSDFAEQERTRKREAEELDRELRMQKALLKIRDRYGKNAIVKGLNLQEGATAMERNQQIGGHRAGEEGK